MKKIITRIFLVVFLLAGALLVQSKVTVSAQVDSSLQFPEEISTDIQVVDLIEATDEAGTGIDATKEPELASPSAEVTQKIQEKTEKDITQNTLPQRSKLTNHLIDNPPTALSWHNFLQHAIYRAVGKGLSANMVVLLILFPVITSVIAAFRHLVGLQGFGVYVPAVLSVAFASTGVLTGLVIFIIILLVALLFRFITKKMRLLYLPRTAMLLWGVSLVVLFIMIISAIFDISFFLAVSIFPLLIIMLLTENFMGTQLMSSQTQALKLTVETLAIAIVCSLIISSETLQKAVILNPELTIATVGIINILVGKYSGLRFFEIFRFNSIIDK